MRRAQRAFGRAAIVWLCVVSLLAVQSCTTGVVVHPEYSRLGTLEKDTYRIHTAERVITTDRVTLEAESFRVSAVLADGKRDFVEPFDVPFGDV